MRVDVPSHSQAFFDQAVRNIETIPGVTSAAVGRVFFSHLPDARLLVEGRAEIADQPSTWVFVSDDFFRTMGIPMVRGRNFSEADGVRSTLVAIVNQTMARRVWPGEDPIGKRFKNGVAGEDSGWLTVVGVTGDVRNGPEGAPVSVFYKPMRQVGYTVPLDFVVRTASDPAVIAESLRAAVRQVDPSIPRFEIQTMDQQLHRMTAQRRFQAGLLTLFSGLALALAAVGIYGVMAYSVAQRTREIGVRMALGAQRGDVLRAVLGPGLMPACLGLAMGIAVSMALARAAGGFLYGVGAGRSDHLCRRLRGITGRRDGCVHCAGAKGAPRGPGDGDAGGIGSC